jgi:hypothetical protein
MSPRVIASFLLACWLAYWLYDARQQQVELDRARSASFEADRNQEWRAAASSMSEARAAANAIAMDVAIGFGPPLILLVGLELKRIRERRIRNGKPL